MQRMRRWIARSLGLIVFVLTLGQVDVDWSGSRAHVRGADESSVEQTASADDRTDQRTR